MNRTNIKIKIINFMKRCTKREEFNCDENFGNMGFINSLFMTQLILFIEKEFDIEISNEDLRSNRLRSINGIISYIEATQENQA